jgi:hypothetical protein
VGLPHTGQLIAAAERMPTYIRTAISSESKTALSTYHGSVSPNDPVIIAVKFSTVSFIYTPLSIYTISTTLGVEPNLNTANFWVSLAYEDAQGREWGFVPYLYGSRNIWVCLDEPLNSDIPAFTPTPAPGPWVPDTEHEDIKKPGNKMLLLVIILVVALTIGTAGLMRVLWKPGREVQGHV